MSRKEEFLTQLGLNPKGRYMFHGTSPESADSIMREGFRLDRGERHGRSGGEGVYLAKTPEEASEYGPEVLAVHMGKTRVSKDAYMEASTRWYDKRPFEEKLQEQLKFDDAHAYRDPDEPHTIVTDPSHLKPHGHAALGRQFEGDRGD